MKARELEYRLPEERIAQRPAARREDARLLVVDRSRGRLEDRGILDLAELLRAGDLLVLNDTKVIRAKFQARRATGARLEGLFLEEQGVGKWCVMLRGGSRVKKGETLILGAIRSATESEGVEAVVTERLGEGRFLLQLTVVEAAERVLDRIGRTPLPPYIHRESAGDEESDHERYQTVYARKAGAVAAPTAGLHLTESLLEALQAQGVATAFVTLHVGPGTFKPIEVDELSEHPMHREIYHVPVETAAAVAHCRTARGRVVAVGTTSVRTLEASWDESAGRVRAGDGRTDLFIFPPYRFRVVDALLTNFHLPRSTLLALVMAFAGVEMTRDAYEHAIVKKYRFFSYGDAMLIV